MAMHGKQDFQEYMEELRATAEEIRAVVHEILDRKIIPQATRTWQDAGVLPESFSGDACEVETESGFRGDLAVVDTPAYSIRITAHYGTQLVPQPRAGGCTLVWDLDVTALMPGAEGQAKQFWIPYLTRQLDDFRRVFTGMPLIRHAPLTMLTQCVKGGL